MSSEHKLLTEISEINKNLSELKEQVKQVQLALTNEVRHQFNKEVFLIRKRLFLININILFKI